MVLPVVVFLPLAGIVMEPGLNQTLVSGALGGVGALIGIGAYQAVKDKGLKGRVLGLAAMIGVAVALLMYLTQTPTDDELLDEDWQIQHVSLLPFETPHALNLTTDAIPQEAEDAYLALDVYVYDDDGRVMYVYDAELAHTPIPVKAVFEAGLNEMLQKIEHSDLEIAYIKEASDQVSAYIRFALPNNDVVDGYGMVFTEDEFMQVMWLMPLERGYSREYLEYFQSRIGATSGFGE